MRKDRLCVVLDIDGVIADFEGEFCMTFGDRSRHLVNLEHRYPNKRASIQNFVADRSTYRHLLPLPIGVQIAEWLATQRAEVHIVSSRPPNSYEITKKWLDDLNVPYKDLTIHYDKTHFIKKLMPDIIVDDIIGVCEQVYNDVPKVTPILVAQPWNEIIFFPRITTLGQFQRIFNRVAYEKLSDDFDGVGMA